MVPGYILEAVDKFFERISKNKAASSAPAARPKPVSLSKVGRGLQRLVEMGIYSNIWIEMKKNEVSIQWSTTGKSCGANATHPEDGEKTFKKVKEDLRSLLEMGAFTEVRITVNQHGATIKIIETKDPVAAGAANATLNPPMVPASSAPAPAVAVPDVAPAAVN